MRVVLEHGDSAEVRELVCALQKVGVRFDIVDEEGLGAADSSTGSGQTGSGLADDDGTEAMMAGLLPIFYNDEVNVRQFLKEIKGMATKDITDLVNQWVEQRRISDYGYSRKGTLWKILHEAGLYSKTQQNWNHRVQ